MYVPRMCVRLHVCVFTRHGEILDRVRPVCVRIFVLVELVSLKCPFHENSFVCVFRVEVHDVLQSLWTQLFSESIPCCFGTGGARFLSL